MRPETGVRVGLAMMVTALLGMIVAGVVTWKQEERRRTRCTSSLKQIGYALKLYAGDVGPVQSGGAADDAPGGE